MHSSIFNGCLLRGLLLSAWLLAGVLPAAGQAPETPPPTKAKKHGKSLFLRPAKNNPADQLRHADRLRRDGHRKARKQYRALVAYWPDSPEAPAAQFAIGEILEERGKLEKAFEEYQYLLSRYAGRSGRYEEVLDRQFAIAQRVMVRKVGKFLFLPGFSAPEKAIPLFESIVRNGPYAKHAPEAQFLIGQAHEQNKEYEDAIVAYMDGQHRYPDSPFAEQSAFRRAYCAYQLAKESPNSEAMNEQAWAAVTFFLNSYPRSEHTAVAQEYRKTLYRNMARYEYDRAAFYDRVARNPRAALMAYSNFVRSHPNSEWTTLAEIRIEALNKVVRDIRPEDEDKDVEQPATPVAVEGFYED
jgi:outer membrane protein assembly factor BamD (BamD/ComL family)